MRAVVYSRVSTEEQDPKGQLTVILDYCKRKGYEVVKVFEENISGAVNPFDRPVFKQMLEYIKSNPVDVIVMHDITRFYRPPPDQVHQALALLKKVMDECNVLVEFVSEPEIEDPLMSELWKFLKSWISSYERVQISLRTKYGLAKLRREGKLFHRPNIIHYYASWLYDKEIKDLTKDELERAKKQLVAIVKKYWNNPNYKKSRIGEILAERELREMYVRYPKAPKSYVTFYRLIKNSAL